MHWGCRLITHCFLTDDMIDRMSNADGAAFNSKLADCAQGTVLPDRGIPAQWIMYDLLQALRTVDKTLADELMVFLIEFLLAQVDRSRKEAMTLAAYFV